MTRSSFVNMATALGAGIALLSWSALALARGDGQQADNRESDQDGTIRDGGGELRDPGDREMSDKEKVQFAEDTQRRIEDGMALVMRRIEDARKSKNLVSLGCLNDKYSSLNSLLKVVETASIIMQDSISQNESEQVEHQFRKVYIASLKVDPLLSEAEQCVNLTSEAIETSEDDAVISELERPSELDPIGDTVLPPDPGTDITLCY